MVDESNPVISRFTSKIKELINNKADKTNATQSDAGLMSAEDKIKLDAIDTQYSINVEKQSTADSGFFSTYVVKQNNTQKGVKINIPKDFLVKSATVKICNTANSPVSGYEVGDKYIDFVINSKDSTDTDEHLYLATKEIGAYPVDEITLTVTNGKLAIKDNGVTWAKLATAVQNTINGKEDASNKVNNVSANSTITQYPSAKCVYDTFCQKNDPRLSDARTPTNHTHKDEDILYNSSTQDKLTPLDMAFVANTNKLAYLPANRIKIWTTTDSGSTWNQNVGTDAQKIKLVTTGTDGLSAGNGSTTNYGQNQIRISLIFGNTNQNSDLYATVSKLLLRIGTYGALGTSVTVYTRKYGATNNYNQQGIYYIEGGTGWNAIPLEGKIGGYVDQTDGSSNNIREIILHFKQNSNSTGNLKVYEIKMIGETTYIAPSQLSKTGHLYDMNENQDVIFPAKIIKNGGTSSQFLKANGDVESLNTTPFTVTYTDGTTSTINFVTR